jgi:hypothetical protein
MYCFPMYWCVIFNLLFPLLKPPGLLRFDANSETVA